MRGGHLGDHRFEEELNLELAIATDRPLEEVARLRVDAGRAQSEHGDADRAVELLTRAVEDLEALHGADSDRVLDVRGLLARALTAARRYHEAEEMLLVVLEERERRYGPDAPLTLIARGHLCRVARLAGRPVEALVLAEQLLADRVRVLGDHDLATLDSMGHVAHTLADLGRPLEAAALFEEQGRLRLGVLGPDHPLVQQSEQNALTVRARAADGETATASLERIVAQHVRDVGEDAPQTLTARGLLAEHLDSVGEHERATDLLRQLVEDRTRVLGATDPATLVSRRRLLVRLAGRPGERVTQDDVDAFVLDLLARFPGPHVDRVAGLVDMATVISELCVRESVDVHTLRTAARQMVALLGQAVEDASAVLEPDHPRRRRAEEPFEGLLRAAADLGALDPPVRLEEFWG